MYCDPPYDGTFSGYHTDGFTEDDQYHPASVLEHRSSEGHPVIVSNSDTSLIRSLYRNFTHHYIKAKRSIGVAAGEGKSATEIIAVSGPRCWVDLIIRVAWIVLPCTEYVHESCRYEQLLRLLTKLPHRSHGTARKRPLTLIWTRRKLRRFLRFQT